ncbi:MAG TPA: hypothetical protein VH437_00625 [Terriglobales bacterium]
MEERAISNPSTTSKAPCKHEGRNVWVLTAYGISGLALFGILAYYVSQFLAR